MPVRSKLDISRGLNLMKKILINDPILIAAAYVFILIPYSIFQADYLGGAVSIGHSITTILFLFVAVGWPANVYFYLGKIMKEKGQSISHVGSISILYFFSMRFLFIYFHFLMKLSILIYYINILFILLPL